MKPIIVALLSVIAVVPAFGAQTSAPRKLGDLNIIPTQVLQRSVSPRFYRSLLVSPVEGWITVRANLNGTRLSGMRIVHSELRGLYDPVALELAKEAVIAGNYLVERPNIPSSVLLHVLVYQIKDATMLLSFTHVDDPGGNQMQYYGSARLLFLKDDKWSEIMGPASLGRGYTVRHGLKNSIADNLRMDGGLAAESTNYDRRSDGRGRRGY